MTVVRMLLAAAAGCVLIVLMALAGSALAPLPTTSQLAIRIALSFLASVMGGYVCGRLAPADRRLATIALLVFAILGVSIVWARLYGQAGQPAGFLPAVSMLSVIGVWAGAMTERATGAK